jgi:HEAT repeat protein
VLALAEFRSPEANELVVRAAVDDDPHVQAAALMQLRQRNLPHAIQLLIGHTASPHEVVRQAVRDSLSEFRFDRFLTSYETLSAEVRHSTGEVVKQVDPEALPRLRAELTSPSRLRRIRGIEMAEAMNAVPELKAELAERLEDPDHLVRAEAARVLETIEIETSRTAIQGWLSRERSAELSDTQIRKGTTPVIDWASLRQTELAEPDATSAASGAKP